ncbi:ABC transporter substrate-binding protein [Mycoplasma sp. T363T]|uniref:ABC transporter substrate-binding protein n=1 Tax=Mycoplasma bradburyae TaxID=2963128 RepID=A0ABT5G9S9_9MOLU|nr:ABC transporter substrate-binding protein [Mycoplasma bradburyae]MDC4163085.1 ABC transporter substrate-binding protein [Mycoplasma bradburyae]MDC4181676.1 ABC transporter substrate-binding protein [Mycoplasma bradburyae]UTS69902.1 ABC transporter substrate-binding protein [Mycoplasma bradburyae]
MKFNLKKTIKLAFLGVIPLSFVISSCGNTQKQDKPVLKNSPEINKTDYDLGLVTDPINTLNYIKYNSLDKIVPSLVDSYIKNGPSNTLKRVLTSKRNYKFGLINIPQDRTTSNFDKYLETNKEDLLNDDGTGGIGSSFYSIDDWNIVGGLADDSGAGSDLKNRATLYGFRNPRNTNNFMAITGYTNVKKNRWSNGDFGTAQDIRDYLEYILDLNTGSQKLDTIRRYGFRGADKFIDAQRDYLSKFNKTYKNPFGRRKYIFNKDLNQWIQDPEQTDLYQSQTFDSNNQPIDTKEVEAIKTAAKNFGFYTGQLFLDYENDFIAKNLEKNPEFSLDKEIQDFKITTPDNKEVTIKLIKNPYCNPYQVFDKNSPNLLGTIQTLSKNENSFTLIFDENQTPNVSYLVFTILESLYPINRRYVETVGGGIDKYGSEPDKFLTNGPFIIPKNDGILLGPNGYINLEKNNDYFDAENTISNKIKIYFSQNRNTNALFFEDGYIAQTYIPANKINSYWADPKIKNFLNKNQGFGTIAYGLNLDLESNADSYIQDQDLRNAIYYAINRDEVLRFVGWDFSFPVNTWTAYGQHKAFDGKNLELFFEGQKAKAKNGKEFDLQNYDFVVHLSKGFNFEKSNRHDLTHDLETAKFYLDRFKAKHPNLKQVNLTFLDNSGDEQVRGGTYLKQALNSAFNGYVNIEEKSLPENIFASYIEKGQYDIIYQNYDRFSGGQPQDSVLTFFKQDGIDSFTQKNIGFKENPVGSYTYTDYLAGLILDALQKTDPNVSRLSLLTPDINLIKNIINNDPSILTEYNQAITTPSAFELNKFTNQNLAKIITKLSEAKPEYKDNRYSEKYVSALVNYIIIDQWPVERDQVNQRRNQNIKKSRLHYAFNLMLPSFKTVDEIAKLTDDTRVRLEINTLKSNDEAIKAKTPNFWKKFIELSLPKFNESTLDYSSRLSSFFSGNFSDQEIEENWNLDFVYQFIGSLEKVIRDSGLIIPLMEVDTNWEVTKVGGVDSLYKFSLQYAYDYTKPPREGLPRTREA